MSIIAARLVYVGFVPSAICGNWFFKDCIAVSQDRISLLPLQAGKEHRKRSYEFDEVVSYCILSGSVDPLHTPQAIPCTATHAPACAMSSGTVYLVSCMKLLKLSKPKILKSS